MQENTAGWMGRRVVLGLLGASLLPRATAWTAAAVSDADRKALVASNTEFALDLYAKLRGGAGNLFYSPYSISTAPAMTYAGARGATADEMARGLRFSQPPARLHPTFGDLVGEINGRGKKRASEISTANALWVRKGTAFVPDFQRIAKGDYGAAAEEVDFARAPERARQTINAWVEKQTHDKIEELLCEGLVDSMTALVLTNAIYFKGIWMQPFHKDATTFETFVRGGEAPVANVPLMRAVGDYPYLDGGTFQALELPYHANDESMIVFLPRAEGGLTDFEKGLTASRLAGWLAKMERREVGVELPRFTVAVPLALKPPLQELGMRQMFSRGADFSGMLSDKDVFVSAAVHKAYIDVNEKGTEAAAATGVVMKATSAPRPIVFRADHPFFDVIRDRRSGSLLFVGRLVNPLAS